MKSHSQCVKNAQLMDNKIKSKKDKIRSLRRNGPCPAAGVRRQIAVDPGPYAVGRGRKR